MQFERLVIESGTNSITFDLHPRLTVIAGLSRIERDGLVNEFLGALGNSRSGVHLEIKADDANRFAVFRPVGAAHRVIDVDRRVEVTDQFVDADGQIDLLNRAGLDAATGRRVMRLSSQDLTEATEHDRMVQTLAKVDQAELWNAADALDAAQRRLEAEAESAGSRVEDAEVIEQIEQRHAAFERSQEQSETVRKFSFVFAGLVALLSLPVVNTVGAIGVVPLLAVALGSVAVSVLFWRRAEAARLAEEEALTQAGAQSYLGFHLERVNNLLSSDLQRRQLMAASERQRTAADQWMKVAGNIDVRWALDNRSEIVALASVRGNMMPGVVAHDADTDQTAAIAHAVMSRLGRLRDLAGTGESFPALLDEPFAHLDSGALPALLELLVRSSERQQIVLLTESPTVCSWAKVEAMTGAIGVIEPSPESRPANVQ